MIFEKKNAPNTGANQKILNFDKMKNIISVKTLKQHWEKPGREDSEVSLKAWYQEVKNSDWRNPNDVKRYYRSASIIGDNRIVFNICGNKYRLIVRINYEAQWVFIRFIGTHSEYDKIDAATI
jgi:mRNA interferase HigB